VIQRRARRAWGDVTLGLRRRARVVVFNAVGVARASSESSPQRTPLPETARVRPRLPKKVLILPKKLHNDTPFRKLATTSRRPSSCSWNAHLRQLAWEGRTNLQQEHLTALVFRASSHTSFPCRLQRGREPFAALYRRCRTGLATKDDWASQLPPDMTPTRGRGCQYRDKPERHIGRSDGVRHISPSLQLLHDIIRLKGASLQFNRNNYHVDTADLSAHVQVVATLSLVTHVVQLSWRKSIDVDHIEWFGRIVHVNRTPAALTRIRQPTTFNLRQNAFPD